MAWWITVYCRRDCSALSAAELARGLRDRDPDAPAGVDYETLAEDYGLTRASAEQALPHLAVTDHLEVRYTPDPEARPILVHVWTSPGRIREEIDEAREVRRATSAATPYLDACRAVIAIELGFSMLEDMGVVFAYELARYLCQKYEGVLVDDDRRWQRIDRGAFTPLG